MHVDGVPPVTLLDLEIERWHEREHGKRHLKVERTVRQLVEMLRLAADDLAPKEAPVKREGNPQPGYSAAEVDVLARLLWCYEPDRVIDILAGRDEATRIDLGRWRVLGIKPETD